MSVTSALTSTASSTSTTAANPLIASATTGSGSATASANAGLSALNYNFNEFLTLFTTQLKNQDPSKPMDTTEMTNQLAMFSNVEQTAGINSRLDKLLAAQQTGGLNSALSYVGRSIEANGNQVVLANGSADLVYEMPTAAQTVRLDVLDSNGGFVTTLSGDASAGVHQLQWSGTDQNGKTVSPGVYQLSVTANTGDATTTVTPVARSTGKVTGVETSGTDTVLDVGALKVKLSDVLAVRS